MAKRKKNNEPLKPTGILLPLSYPEIPDNWLPDDDFSSHRPMLYRAIMNSHHSTFIEFGTGNGSTPFLVKLYTTEKTNIDYISYENDYQWFELMITEKYKRREDRRVFFNNHYHFYSENLLSINILGDSIVFIDCAPGELRKHLISKHSSTAKIIIVHDTEPGAEYVYGLSEILGSFKFRCDLIVEGCPQTTAISNMYDFSNWKTIVNDQIRFI